ncbi:Retrovirus-related Pol polyprotein from type-1 retrotransposable element R1 4 [Eumeta japonica]|uniref:Retrovirus-related Pol polyprotein from type-1 retrotransposable element R1 4 n=1 Tax=Eumeta variegata TaxID=151549 RepID=A0A4C1YTA0_EUMVA|nr:Retrovirus-related Pol polyprotein from type-1 retrotransposable element R1 4 [Eumeta japonica]
MPEWEIGLNQCVDYSETTHAEDAGRGECRGPQLLDTRQTGMALTDYSTTTHGFSHQKVIKDEARVGRNPTAYSYCPDLPTTSYGPSDIFGHMGRIVEAPRDKINLVPRPFHASYKLFLSSVPCSCIFGVARGFAAKYLQLIFLDISGIVQNRLLVLGVVLDERLFFTRHAQTIDERTSKSFDKMSRVSAASWGMGYLSVMIVYNRTYKTTVTYAAGCWYERANLHVIRSALFRIQRPPFILFTKAYCTTSTVTLPVLAEVLPADLKVVATGGST